MSSINSKLSACWRHSVMVMGSITFLRLHWPVMFPFRIRQLVFIPKDTRPQRDVWLSLAPSDMDVFCSFQSDEDSFGWSDRMILPSSFPSNGFGDDIQWCRASLLRYWSSSRSITHGVPLYGLSYTLPVAQFLLKRLLMTLSDTPSSVLTLTLICSSCPQTGKSHVVLSFFKCSNHAFKGQKVWIF